MKLIVFDCDGTLVDSQHMIAEAMTAAFTAVGLPVPDRAAMLRQVGLSVSHSMAAITGSEDIETLFALGREYRLAFSALRLEGRIAEPLFPGAKETLTALAARDDILLGIATGKSRRGVDILLEREGFSNLFATIQTADDAPSKPHPAMIERAMSEADVEPENTLMIGDTSFDILMAKAASVPAIGVGWGYHDPAELMEAGATRVVENFSELEAFLLPNQSMAE
ncbi:MAG: HAD-IA family hydrolase [Rhodomicrobiaceae bacterium]